MTTKCTAKGCTAPHFFTYTGCPLHPRPPLSDSPRGESPEEKGYADGYTRWANPERHHPF